MDPLLENFHRQYLQQVTNLRYPPSKLLAHTDVQQQLHRHFFDDSKDPHLPPPEYQRKVLKRIVGEIVKEAKDEDDEVSDDLMAYMGYLSSLPKQSDFEVAQTPRVLSYFLPDSPLLEMDTSTFDAGEVVDGHSDQGVRRVLIRESPQLLAAGSNVGLRTWEACLRLAYCLSTSSARSTLKGVNVLELGAGTGLLSLICSMSLEADLVLATDGLTHVVDGIEENIALNRKFYSSQRDPPSMPIARVLDWTDLSQMDGVLSIDGSRFEFDYILGADITYHPQLLDPLASLISKLTDFHPTCKVLISATLRNENTLKLWRQACSSHGLNVRDVNEEEDGWTCPLYRQQTGLFHEQAFPIVIMDITRAG